MKTVSLTIDGKDIKARQGQKVLWAALENGIYIPNLCALREKETQDASCRLCWVEIKGKAVTACTETVEEGMVVNTRGQAALRLARTALELLLASNEVDCANCPANGACELQNIAAHLKDKCVLCGRCIWACRGKGIGALGFAHRGFNRRMTTFADKPMADSGCLDCVECVLACPTGALVLKKT